MSAARARRLACCAAILLLCAPAPRAEDLKPFDADYQLYRNKLRIGSGRIVLEAMPDGRFRYHSSTRSSGILAWLSNDRSRESSTWRYAGGGIQPLTYRFEHTSRSKVRRVDLKFDWDKAKVTNTVEGHSWSMEVPPGTLDKWSVQLALMLDLKAGKREFSYPVADGGRLKQYRFRLLGEEITDTPAGRFQAVKLERIRDNANRATLIWCAPALNFLPVQIEQREAKGARYRSVLKQINSGLLFDTR